MEESLLAKGIQEDDKRKSETNPSSLTWATFTEELKRLGSLAGPMVAVALSHYMLLIISMMMVGHLGELALSSAAIAIFLSGVTGFSLLVSLCFVVSNLIIIYFVFLRIGLLIFFFSLTLLIEPSSRRIRDQRFKLQLYKKLIEVLV